MGTWRQFTHLWLYQVGFYIVATASLTVLSRRTIAAGCSSFFSRSILVIEGNCRRVTARDQYYYATARIVCFSQNARCPVTRVLTWSSTLQTFTLQFSKQQCAIHAEGMLSVLLKPACVKYAMFSFTVQPNLLAPLDHSPPLCWLRKSQFRLDDGSCKEDIE